MPARGDMPSVYVVSLQATLSKVMRASFEIRSGRKPVTIVEASAAQEAVVDYVRSLGCHDDEVRRLGTAEVAWRGAVFSAVALESQERQRQAA